MGLNSDEKRSTGLNSTPLLKTSRVRSVRKTFVSKTDSLPISIKTKGDVVNLVFKYTKFSLRDNLNFQIPLFTSPLERRNLDSKNKERRYELVY